MRAPGLKALTDTFRISEDDAKLIRKLAKATDSAEDLEALIAVKCPKTADYVRSMHSSPYGSHMWRVTVALHAMDVVMGTHGVEALGPTSGPSYSPPYEYLNMGDTYDTTLIYRRKTDTLSIGSYGDVVEKHPSWM